MSKTNSVAAGDILEQMIAAAKTAAGQHWNQIRKNLRSEFARARDEAAAIALEVKQKSKSKQQATIELQSVRDSLRDTARAEKVALKAAAQDAINAALEVLRGAVNKTAGIALL